MENPADVRTPRLWATDVSRPVSRTLQAGAAYFAIVFVVGFVLGTLRALVLVSVLGPTGAVLVEVPVMLTVSWIVCGRLLARFAVPAAWRYGLLMGVLAFFLLMMAELGVSVLAFGRSVAEHLAGYRGAGGQIGLAAQIAFAILPMVRTRKRYRKGVGSDDNGGWSMSGSSAVRAVVRRAGEGSTNRAFDLPRRFLIQSEDAGGSFSQWVEDVPPRAGPPMHVHHGEHELFRILAGEFRFWCAGDVADLGEGDTVLVPRGAHHSFRNIGDRDGQLLITMTPGGAEGFFIEVEEQGLHPSRDMPRIVEIAARYGLEFVGPPPA